MTILGQLKGNWGKQGVKCVLTTDYSQCQHSLCKRHIHPFVLYIHIFLRDYYQKVSKDSVAPKYVIFGGINFFVVPKTPVCVKFVTHSMSVSKDTRLGSPAHLQEEGNIVQQCNRWCGLGKCTLEKTLLMNFTQHALHASMAFLKLHIVYSI